MSDEARNPEQLRAVALPKWPMMYTTGIPMQPEQAWEIIRRTDYFFYYGGSHSQPGQFEYDLAKLLGMPLDRDDLYTLDQEARHAAYNEQRQQREAFWERWGLISLAYLPTGWVSSSYVYGPHGWVHPDGQVGYLDNVGKWPSVAEIEEEWQTLATAFPFIEVGVTLMSGEHNEENIHPMVSLYVKEGKVRLVDPDAWDVHRDHPLPTRRGPRTVDYDPERDFEDMMQGAWDVNQRGMPLPALVRWAEWAEVIKNTKEGA